MAVIKETPRRSTIHFQLKPLLWGQAENGDGNALQGRDGSDGTEAKGGREDVMGHAMATRGLTKNDRGEVKPNKRRSVDESSS